MLEIQEYKGPVNSDNSLSGEVIRPFDEAYAESKHLDVLYHQLHEKWGVLTPFVIDGLDLLHRITNGAIGHEDLLKQQERLSNEMQMALHLPDAIDSILEE